MANLSNINGKFVVDTAGNIGVGTLTPRSNVNTTNISIQSSGTARLLVNNTGASGKEYGIYSSANGDFGVFDYGAVSARLIINSSGNATFSGTVQTTQITATNGLNYLKRNTDASLQLRSENTRSGLFITKPATDTVMGSALVLADESYRFGTANYYHIVMLQNGNTYFNQNVGIGTTTPAKKLEVATTGINQSSTIRIQGTDGNGNGHPLDLKMNGADDSFSILIGQGGGATPSTVLFNGNRNGNVGIGTNSPTYNLVVSSGGASGVEFAIATATGLNEMLSYNRSTSVFEKLRTQASQFEWYTDATANALVIQSGGNVGIGIIPTASSKLNIGGLNSGYFVDLTCSGPGGSRAIRFIDGGTPTKYNWLVGAQHNVNNAFEITASTAVGGTTFNSPLFLVNQSGNVGVGITSPDEKLSVNGNIFLQGNDDYIAFNTSASSGHPKIKMNSDADFSFLNTAGSNLLHIENGGYVGIANDNPASLLSVGSTSYGSTARIDCMAADSQNAEIRAFGNAQGTGVVYVGQSIYYGGGIAYNGDGSPVYGDFGTDRVTLFGRHGGTSHKVADWSYSNTDKTFSFYGPISVSGSTGTAGQVLTSNGSSQASWQTPSAGGDFKTKGVTLATVTSSGTTVATTVNASTVTNNSCGVIKFTMGHAANIIVVSFVVYETSNMWFVNRADEGANSNNDNDITYSGVATNTLTFKAKNSSPSSGYNGVVMIECFPPSMFTL